MFSGVFIKAVYVASIDGIILRLIVIGFYFNVVTIPKSR